MKNISIDKFSDLKNLNTSKETKIYRHSWQSLLISYIIVLAQVISTPISGGICGNGCSITSTL